MNNVVDLVAYVTGDVPPDQVLAAARAAHLDPVVVIGRDAAGDLYVAGSDGDHAQTIALLERAKAHVIEHTDP